MAPINKKGILTAVKGSFHTQANGDMQASELIIVKEELALQNLEKENLIAELNSVNSKLAFENEEKEERAKELLIANTELSFQNQEKEKRALELGLANVELAFQNQEKEKRAQELSIANIELAFQNTEKEKRSVELIKLNRDLAKSEDSLRQLSAELELKVIERTQQLEFINKELEAFSYSVSHDLRAPIRAISGFSKILSQDFADKLGQEGLKYLQLIINDSKRMGLLIDDLLAFSKLGRKEVSLSEINMTSLVEGIWSELLFDEATKIKIEFKLNSLPNAMGDPSLIKQVWINLISNAIKYSQYKEKTIIEISALKKEDVIVYSIEDNGAGFDMQYYDNLFGVFQRLHSQEEFDGTGIGLAIIQKIIHRHNGTVWAESKVEEGACFHFTLPNKINN